MLSRCRGSKRMTRMRWNLISEWLGKGIYAGMTWATHDTRAPTAYFGIGCF